MSTPNKKNSPAPVAAGNEGKETSRNRSPEQSNALRPRPRPRVYHRILNQKEVDAGKATVCRALCGHTFPARRATPLKSAPGVERERWVKCPDCQSLERLYLELQGEETTEWRLIRGLLARLDRRHTT